jgi:hypothetical protein
LGLSAVPSGWLTRTAPRTIGGMATPPRCCSSCQRQLTPTTRNPDTPADSVPLAQVARTLRQTTEVLAAELAYPGTVNPSWSQTEWSIARAAVAIHGIAGLLEQRSRWQGPPAWVPFLQAQRTHTAARLRQIEALLHSIDTRAKARGLVLVALKGAALHAQGLYEPGVRPMADLDLLAAPEQIAQSGQLLAELGFELTLETVKHQSFELPRPAGSPAPFGEDAARPLKVELHARVYEQLPLTEVDLTSLILPSAAPGGVQGYSSPHGLLAHMLLHAAGSMLWRSARLLQLHDIHLLSAPLTVREWHALLATVSRASPSGTWWMYAPLRLTEHYYGGIPAEVLAKLGSECHWWLRRAYNRRRITDVSISNLWVSAFPGIEWTRSLPEMGRYAAQRIWPSARTLALRKTLAAAQPHISGGEWAELSQGRRMLRWVFTRQPRQESLQTVHAALQRDLSFSS